MANFKTIVKHWVLSIRIEDKDEMFPFYNSND
jgi:hypothetical protein